MTALKFTCPHCGRELCVTAVRNHRRRFRLIGECPPTQDEIRARKPTKANKEKIAKARRKRPRDKLSRCDKAHICKHWT